MLGDIFIHCFTMVIVIGQRIVNRCEADMRIVRDQFFWGLSVVQNIDHNGSYCDSGPLNTRTSAADAGITCDMRMNNCGHVWSLSQASVYSQTWEEKTQEIEHAVLRYIEPRQARDRSPFLYVSPHRLGERSGLLRACIR